MLIVDGIEIRIYIMPSPFYEKTLQSNELCLISIGSQRLELKLKFKLVSFFDWHIIMQRFIQIDRQFVRTNQMIPS